MDVLKVAARSNPNSVAGAPVGHCGKSAAALNQAIKDVTIAWGVFLPPGWLLSASLPWRISRLKARNVRP